MSYYDDCYQRYYSHFASEIDRTGYKDNENRRLYHEPITQENFWTFKAVSIPSDHDKPEGYIELDTKKEDSRNSYMGYFDRQVKDWMQPKNWRLLKKIYNENNKTFVKSWW